MFPRATPFGPGATARGGDRVGLTGYRGLNAVSGTGSQRRVPVQEPKMSRAGRRRWL